ncbi:hypothetical protein DLJ53_30230 [Acuticoccus sediminis]|uniref:Guanylate cyclase domain-containing protein n=1 Tax=Acuticoccus sediminis TaxID=2184697 RepID=A0A8B2NDV7_9HYPH|nr:adenylate/guanylate cyclase domain-containing protein [Acuticoccus sediminis]RAH96959.1 hypothetical protein DLJ53_30230 [Acuticoccus sediminis]
MDEAIDESLTRHGAASEPEGRGRRTERGLFARALPRIVIALVATLLGLFIGQRVETPFADFVLAFRAPPASDRIVVVKIDQQTVETLPYISPVDREFLADLVTTLDAAGPAAIGLDILFKRATTPAADDALRAAVERASSPVVVAYGDGSDGLTEREVRFADAFPGQRGKATLLRDRADGIIRRLPGDADPPPFALALTRATGERDDMPAGRIVYAEGSFNMPAAHLVGRLPPAWFRDKYVLIGADLEGRDRHATPRAAMVGAEKGTIPGVVVHAHILSQLLAGTERQLLPTWALILSAVVGAVAGLCLRPLAPLVAIATALACIALYGLIAAATVALTVETPPMLTPVLSFLFAGAGTLGHRWRGDRLERNRLRHMFGQYVSPRVVTRLMEAEEDPKLGGERREVTHIFTDLQGFTALAETLEPETTAEILNSYLDGMISIVLEAEGTVDKLVGDALVAFFGAPDRQPDQASRAVECARRLAVYCEESRLMWRDRGIALGITRVGVHTGFAVVGNFGGRRFFDYTAIGDSVNVAARLESANNGVGTHVLVSERTRRRAEGAFRPVGRIEVKGRREPVTCYEPIDAPDPTYDAAYEAMANGEARARDLFKTLAGERPSDRLIAVHAARLVAGPVDDLIARS